MIAIYVDLSIKHVASLNLSSWHEHARDKILVLAPIVIEQLVEQRAIEGEFVKLSDAMQLVVVFNVEVPRRRVMCFVLELLDDAHETVWQY